MNSDSPANHVALESREKFLHTSPTREADSRKSRESGHAFPRTHACRKFTPRACLRAWKGLGYLATWIGFTGRSVLVSVNFHVPRLTPKYASTYSSATTPDLHTHARSIARTSRPNCAKICDWLASKHVQLSTGRPVVTPECHVTG